MAKTKSTYRFRKSDSIGDPSAETDSKYLAPCFVDTGYLETLKDLDDPRCIVLGRTGSGKTALLNRIRDTEERVIIIDPHQLALSYITNSSTIKFIDSLDPKVSIDPFLRFLWRHVFVVALLKRRFAQSAESRGVNIIRDLVRNLLQPKAYKDVTDYIDKYGDVFLNSSPDEVIRESVRTIETELKGSVALDLHGLFGLGAEGSQRLRREDHAEVSQRANDIINGSQNSALVRLFESLDTEFLTDPAKRFYILIDGLDEDWVEDSIRYRLIRALIEIIRDMNHKVRYAKASIALRSDLFERVLTHALPHGFQSEKYESLCLHVNWQRADLQEVLDLRVHELIRHQYAPSTPVKVRDVMTGKLGAPKQLPLDYMLDRTLQRPRDCIAFFNICLKLADDQPVVTAKTVARAETQYSDGRLDSLAQEWADQYRCLRAMIELFKKRATPCLLRDIDEDALDTLYLTQWEGIEQVYDFIPVDVTQIRRYARKQLSTMELRTFIALTLYKVGAVGLKVEPYKGVSWAHSGLEHISEADIIDETRLHVHKMLWRTLGIRQEASVVGG